jgi:alkanesulfonate monooxygenase SsuD/methylene tetrahydromethanopterin reductase-like flavin-dependent oxidoreductase (luciferase family)
MKYGISIPNFGYYFDARRTAELAHKAEEAGWDGFFVWDHLHWPMHPAPVADPWVLLTAIALRTERIRLGTMVTPLSRRRPWKLARETLTLDHLSNGRLILGVGLGYFEEEEFAIFGEATQPRKRAEMLDEALQVLDGLWSGEPFHFDGEHYHLNEIQYHPAALQQPRIPVWVAGMWPNKAPARRAARWDGFFPIPKEDRPLSPDEVHEILTIVRANRPIESADAFDMVVSGYSEGGEAQWDQDLIHPLRKAGATWFLEACDPWRYDYDQALARIRKGPPEIK